MQQSTVGIANSVFSPLCFTFTTRLLSQNQKLVHSSYIWATGIQKEQLSLGFLQENRPSLLIRVYLFSQFLRYFERLKMMPWLKMPLPWRASWFLLGASLWPMLMRRALMILANQMQCSGRAYSSLRSYTPILQSYFSQVSLILNDFFLMMRGQIFTFLMPLIMRLNLENCMNQLPQRLARSQKQSSMFLFRIMQPSQTLGSQTLSQRKSSFSLSAFFISFDIRWVAQLFPYWISLY